MKFFAFLLIVFSCIACALSVYNLFNVVTHPLKFKEEITTYAQEYDMSPELIASVINVESAFRENAKSNKNAVGLMQIKLSTANYLNELNNQNNITEEQLFTPKTNIKYGSQYLKYLLEKFQNLNTALASYNAGETRVRDWLSCKMYSVDGKTLTFIPYEETRNYVEKINKNLKFYSRIFKN